MDSLFEEVAAGIVFTSAQYYSSNYDKQKKSISILSGHAYTKQILNGHSSNIQSVFRMPAYTLDKLQEYLFDHTNLASSQIIGVLYRLKFS